MKKIKLGKFDWKKFLLEKGERAALYTCLGIMGLMLMYSLFWPGNGLFSGSASANAAKLQAENKKARDTINNSKPSDTELAKYTFIPEDLMKKGEQSYVDPDLFKSNAEKFLGTTTADSKRRAPKVLEPVEYAAAYAQIPVSKYIFSTDNTKILVVRGDKGSVKGGSSIGEFNKQYGKVQRSGFNPGGGGGQSLFGSFNRPENPGGFEPKEDKGPLVPRKDVKVEYLALSEIGKVTGDARLAQDILPLRMNIVAGSFPLRKQTMAFQQALRLQSMSQVFSERYDKKGPQLQFLLPNVERRVTNANADKPGEWERVNILNHYRELNFLTGKRFADDRVDLQPLLFNPLAMPRPAHHLTVGEGGTKEGPGPGGAAQPGGEGQPPRDPNMAKDGADEVYPDVERRMPTIQAVLEQIRKQMDDGKTQVRQDKRFRINDPDPLGLTPEEPEGKPPETSGTPGDLEKEWQPYEYCVFRFLDFKVEPGKTYEYRIQIRLANPNIKHPNVAFPDLAKPEEILSEWFTVKNEQGEPLKLTVPAESHFYASDVRPLDAGRNQVAVQFHRWLDYLPPMPGSQLTFSVGDWVVADQVLVNRGEIMTRTKHVEVPVWMYTQNDFILATNPKVRESEKYMIPLTFSPGVGDTLLVDFQGGSQQRYSKYSGVQNDKPQYTTITDKGPTELLYLSPDGKLLARDSEADKRDANRERRLKEYKARVEKIKKASEPKKEEKKP